MRYPNCLVVLLIALEDEVIRMKLEACGQRVSDYRIMRLMYGICGGLNRSVVVASSLR
jgi:hypothetical protein